MESYTKAMTLLAIKLQKKNTFNLAEVAEAVGCGEICLLKTLAELHQDGEIELKAPKTFTAIVADSPCTDACVSVEDAGEAEPFKMADDDEWDWEEDDKLEPAVTTDNASAYLP